MDLPVERRRSLTGRMAQPSRFPTAPGYAGQGVDEAGQRSGQRGAVGVGPVGHHRGEDRAAEPVQLLGERIAPLGPDEERTASVGLVGLSAHQPASTAAATSLLAGRCSWCSPRRCCAGTGAWSAGAGRTRAPAWDGLRSLTTSSNSSSGLLARTHDPGGIDRDRLLTNVMLYWLTGTANSAARIFYEHARLDPDLWRSDVPTGVAVFAEDLAIRPYAEQFNTIVHWSKFDRGGHFPALEEPGLLVTDIRSFFTQRRTT
jgi:pimeloyl-ACP methyl ester carboxylesterase